VKTSATEDLCCCSTLIVSCIADYGHYYQVCSKIVEVSESVLYHLQLLLPLDIYIHSTAPQSTNHHIEVLVSDIVMNVTASSVRTSMAILTSLTKKKVGIVAAILSE